MGPMIHLGLTATFLSGARLAGYDVNTEIAAAIFVSGIFLDGDKTLEIISNRVRAKKHIMPDITARCRILHSIFAWPFGLVLSFAVCSWLPFIAVLSHIFLDSFVPGLIKDSKNYPSHPCRKWLANPFSERSWAKVTIGWPVTYPPEFNWVYNKLAPAIGGVLFFLSVLYWNLK